MDAGQTPVGSKHSDGILGGTPDAGRVTEYWMVCDCEGCVASREAFKNLIREVVAEDRWTADMELWKREVERYVSGRLAEEDRGADSRADPA